MLLILHTIATFSTVAPTSIVQISQSDYEHFLQLQADQASQLANIIMHESTSGTNAFIASSGNLWV